MSNSQARFSRSSHGFTLIELLVAMAIVVAIALTLVHSLQIAFKARDVADLSLETGRSADVVMEILKNDFQCACPPRGVFAGAFEGQSGTMPNNSDDVTFFTTAPAPVHAPNQVAVANGEIKQVEITVEQPVGSTDYVLVRRTLNNLSSQNQQNDIDEEVLCRHVVSFSVQYCDATWTWNPTWDSTASTPTNTLPLAVEVTLNIRSSQKDSGGQPLIVPYKRVFAIPAFGPSGMIRQRHQHLRQRQAESPTDDADNPLIIAMFHRPRGTPLAPGNHLRHRAVGDRDSDGDAADFRRGRCGLK